jgi:hypothetical protein
MADGSDGAEVLVDLDEGAPASPGLAAIADAEDAAAADVVDLPDGDGAGRDGGVGSGRLPARAKQLPDGRVLLPLLHPVTLRIRRGGEVHEESYPALTFRRLNGADLRAVDNAGKKGGEVALARSAGIPQLKFDALYDRMDAADILDAAEVLVFFSGAGPKTGR